MLRCGTTVIDLHGSTRLPELIAMFEAELASTGPATETSDQIKEAVVILIGRLARHLDPSDSRLPSIVERLVGALKTPAEQVQMAVSECLSPLVKVMKSPPSQLVDRLLDELSNSPSYAARRGAAYGLAGVVKGLGISSIKEYNIIDRLRAATEDKKRFEPRQGAMFAFETLSRRLRVRQLSAQLLQSHFKVPVFLLEFVCGLLLLSKGLTKVLEGLVQVVLLLLHVLDNFVPLSQQTLQPSDLGKQTATNLESKLRK